LVGLKPTNTRVSLGPEFGDLLGGFAVEHVVTRSVRDSAAILDITSTPMPGDPYPMEWTPDRFRSAAGEHPERPLRVGFTTTHAGTAVHEDCAHAVQVAVKMLGTLGHEVEESHPAAIEDPAFFDSFGKQMCAATAWALDHYWPRRTGVPVTAEDVEPLTWGMAEAGRSLNAGDYLAGRETQQLFGRAIATWFDDGRFDLLMTPTTPVRPPSVGTLGPIESVFFTFAFNSTGQPAISLPLHQSDDGLPFGVQFVARHGREDLLLSIAAQLEEQTDWASHTPPISA
jgi:amidase